MKTQSGVEQIERTIYIRADGNENIASGHIMRCLSIAGEITSLGGNVVFILADESPVALLKGKSIPYHILHSDWKNLETETDSLISYLQQEKAKIILVDSYSATREYLENLGKYVGVVYIDDYVDSVLPVRAIVHYSVFDSSRKLMIEKQKTSKYPELLWGADYIPLRKEFSHVTYKVRKEVCTVLITTGGADRLGMGVALTEALLKKEGFQNLQFHIIAGAFYPDLPRLKELEAKNKQIRVLTDVTNMSEQMTASDVAISAGGTTLYELAACGIPTICFEVADNQNGAWAWDQNDCMIFAGNAEENKEECINNCIAALTRYMSGYEERVRKSNRIRKIIDGKGAFRIAEYILKKTGGLEL